MRKILTEFVVLSELFKGRNFCKTRAWVARAMWGNASITKAPENLVFSRPVHSFVARAKNARANFA